MGKLPYTKEHLERIVLTQLENLDAMHDYMIIVKKQTELVARMNEKLEAELSDIKRKVYATRNKHHQVKEPLEDG